jgi:uncharacterized protein (TIGR02231 family)
MISLSLLILASTSNADRVVIFPDRAQVTRVTQLTCGARVPVKFENIPPAAGADSFRARVEGGTIDGLRSELITREKEFSAKAEALNAQIEALDLERNALNDQFTRAQGQQQLANQFTSVGMQQISRELAAEKPDTKAWQVAIDSSLSTGAAGARLKTETRAKLVQADRKLQELQLKLEGVQVAAQKRSWTVEVLASCPAGQTAELALTYLVGGASWTPSYEARADEAGNAVDLSTWATISQSTGEDWAQVDLTLSTAVPSQNATPPELKKLLVQGYEKAPEKKVLVRREEYVEHAQASAESPPEPQAQTTPRVRAQGLSVQLVVPEKSRVPGDSSPVRLFVGKSHLKASFELRATPKLFPVAFRVAELTNQAPWPLLPGRIDAFRSTGLVGRYPLERVAQGGVFTITFGVEDSVRVKRSVVEELKRDTGLFNDKKRFTYAYHFELANYGKTPLDVALSDHLPVSEMNDIAVSISEKTTAGYSVNPQDGIAKWKVSLKAGEKKSVDFAFRVDVPTSYDMGGL